MASSSLRDRPYNEHDTGPVEKDGPQKAAQAAPVVNISVFGEAPLSIAECSRETSASNLCRIGEDDPVTVEISKFTTTKILGKRSSPCGVEYRCQLEPLWLPIDLVEEVQMGRVHV